MLQYPDMWTGFDRLRTDCIYWFECRLWKTRIDLKVDFCELNTNFGKNKKQFQELDCLSVSNSGNLTKRQLSIFRYQGPSTNWSNQSWYRTY